MALTYGFYNSVNHDRRYYSTQFSNIVNAMITDGVFLTRGNAFAVTPAANGLGVNVDTGFAWFGSTWTENDQLLPLTLTAADVSRPRIDAIVLDVNGNDDVRTNDIIVVTGAPYSTPTKPALINEGKHTQHALAYVTVNANATSILAENIELVVGQNETPYADAKLSGIDITALFQQWQGEFETWFADVQSQLEGDVATNLLNKINALEQNKLDKVTDRATAEDLTTGAQDKWVSAGMLREEKYDNTIFSQVVSALPKKAGHTYYYTGIPDHYVRIKHAELNEFKNVVYSSYGEATTYISIYVPFSIVKIQNDEEIVLYNSSKIGNITTMRKNDSLPSPAYTVSIGSCTVSVSNSSTTNYELLNNGFVASYNVTFSNITYQLANGNITTQSSMSSMPVYTVWVGLRDGIFIDDRSIVEFSYPSSVNAFAAVKNGTICISLSYTNESNGHTKITMTKNGGVDVFGNPVTTTQEVILDTSYNVKLYGGSYVVATGAKLFLSSIDTLSSSDYIDWPQSYRGNNFKSFNDDYFLFENSNMVLDVKSKVFHHVETSIYPNAFGYDGEYIYSANSDLSIIYKLSLTTFVIESKPFQYAKFVESFRNYNSLDLNNGKAKPANNVLFYPISHGYIRLYKWFYDIEKK